MLLMRSAKRKSHIGSKPRVNDGLNQHIPAANANLAEDEGCDLAALLVQAARGDASSWRELVQRYARRIYALAKSRCRNHDVSEDITQSVFATLAQKLAGGEYGEEGKFEAWLFRIAANRVRDHIRRQRLRPTGISSEALAAVPETNLRSLEEALGGGANSGKVRLERLRTAMEMLNESDREIVTLRHHGGLSFKQIADMLSEPLGTLLARHHRALRKLKEAMGEWDPGELAVQPSAPAEDQTTQAARG